jgi:CRP-like cAMP-binding protein
LVGFLKGNDANRKSVREGDVLFRQDDPADFAYLVHQGKIDVTVDRGGRIVKLAEIGPGEIVGEMSLLSGKEHSATAVVSSAGSVIKIDRFSLEDKFNSSDPVMKKIIFCLVNRLYKSNHIIAENNATIIDIPRIID